jgi:foldase protein PrsA
VKDVVQRGLSWVRRIQLAHLPALKLTAFGACALLLAAVATATVVSYAGPKAGIVARVNGEPITERELWRMMADPAVQRHAEKSDMRRIMATAAKGEAPKQDASQPAKELERHALRRLIQGRLLVQEASRRAIKLTDKEIEEALAAFKARFKDEESFVAWRKSKDFDDDRALIEAMRTEVLASRVSAALVKETRVSDDEVNAYYEKNPEQLKIPAAARLQLITVKDKAGADEVLRALKKGADFGSLARERSKGARASQGGDLGWVNADTLPPALHKAVERLRVGQTGGPVQYGPDFMIVRLLAQRAAGTRAPAEARQAIEQRLLRAKHNETVTAWLLDREKASKIEILR